MKSPLLRADRESSLGIETVESQAQPAPVAQFVAEFAGSLLIMTFGCGVIVFSPQNPAAGAGAVGESLAFGLAVAIASYALPAHSLAYFNPALALGLALARRLKPVYACGLIIAQVIGATAGAAVVAQLASGRPGFNLTINGLSATGYADHSPAGYDLTSAAIVEFIGAIVIMLCALRSDRRRNDGMWIGLATFAVALFAHSITGGCANPSRSTGPALLLGGWALHQLWLFWVAPALGAGIGAVIYQLLRSAPAKSSARSVESDPPKMHRPRKHAS